MREWFPKVGFPVKGGEAVPKGCAAKRSTLDRVTEGNKIPSRKRFQHLSFALSKLLALSFGSTLDFFSI